MSPTFLKIGIHPFHSVFCIFSKIFFVTVSYSLYNIIFNVLHTSRITAVDSFLNKSLQKEVMWRTVLQRGSSFLYNACFCIYTCLIIGMCAIHHTLYIQNYFLTSVSKIYNILPFSIIFSLLIGHNLDAPATRPEPKNSSKPFAKLVQN